MNILIVEDEENVSSFIKQGLEDESFKVWVVDKGHEVWDYLKKQEADLIILDIVLPDISGYNLCQMLRREYGDTFKIIMLTALNSTDHVVQGLDAGANDYIGKPFEFKELLARINTLFRSYQPHSKSKIYQYQSLEVNDDTKEAKRAGKVLTLTPKEYNLLLFFIKNQGRVIDRRELLENVWELDFDLGTNVVDVYVNYLRNKVDKGFEQKMIHTVKGMGYYLRLDGHEHKT